jgi:hypothetical protein
MRLGWALSLTLGCQHVGMRRCVHRSKRTAVSRRQQIGFEWSLMSDWSEHSCEQFRHPKVRMSNASVGEGVCSADCVGELASFASITVVSWCVHTVVLFRAP